MLANLLTKENFELFLVFFVPGLLSLKFYSILTPIKSTADNNAVLESFLFGGVNFSIVYLLMEVASIVFIRSHWIFTAIFILGLFVSPFILAYAFYKFRNSKFLASIGALNSPPSGWDHFFLLKKPCFVRLHLKDGTEVGGLYSDNSCASLYPEEPDLYLEKVCTLHPDNGSFTGFVKGSSGMIVKMKECKLIEFYELE